MHPDDELHDPVLERKFDALDLQRERYKDELLDKQFEAEQERRIEYELGAQPDPRDDDDDPSSDPDGP